MSESSYHDLLVTAPYAAMHEVPMGKLPFNVTLVCNRQTGWQLIKTTNLGAIVILGEEFSTDHPLRVSIDYVCSEGFFHRVDIVNNLPTEKSKP